MGFKRMIYKRENMRILFLAVSVFCLFSTPSFGMCTGTVVKVPVLLENGQFSADTYEVGDKVWYITQAHVEDGRVILCTWSGPCYDGDYIHLSKVISVHGYKETMTGAEIRANSYESNEPCALSTVLLR
jgi:hypothetical protein